MADIESETPSEQDSTVAPPQEAQVPRTAVMLRHPMQIPCSNDTGKVRWPVSCINGLYERPTVVCDVCGQTMMEI